MNENWINIAGYDGEYQVSNLGRVKSLKYGKERILRQKDLTGGYMYVWLCKYNKVKCCRVHRLVAKAFLNNPENLPEVNHKDENVKNNHLSNLEWVSTHENHTYGTRMKRIAQALEKPIMQFDPAKNRVIARFSSGAMAARITGLNANHIRECCRGARNTHGGYAWKWDVAS